MAEFTAVEVGEYRLVARVATGGMAEIFRAEPLAGGEPLVLKRLLPRHREDPAFVSRFVGEAKLCVKLRHPNVVRTHRLFRKGPDYFMVQEFVEGLSVRSLLDARRRSATPLPLPATLELLRGLLAALDYLHRARLGMAAVTIVHRDVNPSNLLVDRAGAVKLTDFGVAEASLHPEGHAEAGTLVGTSAYMSPEQVLGKPLDPRSDLFSSGSLLYECLANHPPFESEVEFELLSQVRSAKPPPLTWPGPGLPELVALVAKAMAAEPEARFATAADFRRTLLAVGERLGQPPSSATLAEAVISALP